MLQYMSSNIYRIGASTNACILTYMQPWLPLGVWRDPVACQRHTHHGSCQLAQRIGCCTTCLISRWVSPRCHRLHGGALPPLTIKSASVDGEVLELQRLVVRATH